MAMFGAKDLSNSEAESSQSMQNKGNPDEKMFFSQKGVDGFPSKPNNNFASPEPTLHYLLSHKGKGKEVVFASENSKQDHEKCVAIGFFDLNETSAENENSLKRGAVEEEVEIAKENSSEKKKQKLDQSLNLSLGLPDVSPSLTVLNPMQNIDSVVFKPTPSRSAVQSLAQKTCSNDFSFNIPASLSHSHSHQFSHIDSVVFKPKPIRSGVQSLVESKNTTQKTCSNDFSFNIPASLSYSHSHSQSNNTTQKTCSNDLSVSTPASVSYSHSHQFMHNPSCSLMRNSADNHEHSVGRIGHKLCCGDGTNASVHSQFRPIGDGMVALNNPSMVMQGNQEMNKDLCNPSGLPLGLPPRPPRVHTHSGDSRRVTENLRGFGSVDDGGRARKVSKPEKILKEIVCDSIPYMRQIILRLTDEMLKSTKEYLKRIIANKTKKFLDLQAQLNRRFDLTKEILSKGHEFQLEILVAVKMGLKSFLSKKIRLPRSELVEIFLFMRCRNVSCLTILSNDDCTCNSCSENKGFCNRCMCTVCLKFDNSTNTCTWVGCDICSHWCHTVCGIQRNLIKPGQILKGHTGPSEMTFHCSGCGYSSTMFGFVKEVIICCGSIWSLGTLKKEFDCVRKIFKGSDDIKGKELHNKVDELLSKLETEMISTSDAIESIIQFFKPHMSGVTSKRLMATQASLRKCKEPVAPPVSLPPDFTLCNWKKNAALMATQASLRKDKEPVAPPVAPPPDYTLCNWNVPHQNDKNAALMVTQASMRKDKEPVAPPVSLPPDYTLCNWNVLHQNDKNAALMVTQASLRKDKEPVAPPISLPPDYTLCNWNVPHPNDKNAAPTSAPKNDDKFQFGKSSKKDGLVSYERIIKMKEAEALLYQSKADEVRREAEVQFPVIRSMSEKLEKEYVERFSRLHFDEAADRRRKKAEEVGVLKNSHDKVELRMRELAAVLDCMGGIRQQ